MSGVSQTLSDGYMPVGIRALWKFWRGDREAMLAIASARGVLGIGALFVLSAALAREYDGADLLAEPWHLAVPFAASVGTSLLLFSLVYGVGKLRGIGAVPFGRTYLRFLGVYWCTAPLAWLYAIPVETFMTPLSATQSNLALLAIVSAWRVWLMTRFVRTLFGTSIVAARSVVLFFADALALVAVVVTPKPIISVMGGISHTDAEMAILTATTILGFFCVASLPLWLASTAAVAARGAPWQFAFAAAVPPTRPTPALRYFATASVLLWLLVLPITQWQQRLARRVDDQLKAGKLREAIGEMGSHNRADFPARWDPPPHIGYGGREPPVLDVMEVVVAMDSPPWVRALFTEKFGNTLYNPRILWGPDVIDDKQFHRYVHVLKKLPEGPSFAARQQGWLTQADVQPEQSDAHRADVKALLDLAKSYDPDRDPPEHWARSY